MSVFWKRISERIPEPKRFFWFIFAVALAIRLIALRILPDQSFPDSLAYAEASKDLFKTGIISNHFCMPLYPVFMGLLGGLNGIRYLDIIFSSLSAGLISWIAFDIWKSRTAMALAGLAATIYPYFVFYSISALSENSFIFFLLLGFYFLNRDRWSLGSVSLILSILIRPSIDFISPLLIFGYALVVHRKKPQIAVARTLTYFIIYAVMMTPWWLHNVKKYDGRFVRLNLASGYVLYSGNNSLNTSGGGIGGVDLDTKEFDSITDIFERNTAMKNAAISFIIENPVRFVKLSFTKFLRFWRLWPYASQYSGALYVILSCLSFVPVLLCAIWSLFLFNRRKWLTVSPIILLIAFMTAVHMLTIGSIRYRLPIEPFLIIFAVRPWLKWMDPQVCLNTDSNA